MSQEIDCHMTKYCHILRSVINPNVRGILIHYHIQSPMQFILNMPLRTHALRKVLHFSCATTDEIACFVFNSRSDPALALNHANTLETIPGITR